MNEKQIFGYFVSKGMTKEGAAGVVGNLIHESGLKATNLQNNYEVSLGMSDATYTDAVDNWRYGNFAYDKAGYGLAQWTYWSRKQALLEYARKRGVSIGDYEMQLDFLMMELEAYPGLMSILTSTSLVREASDAFMTQFERPADQSNAAKNRRALTSKEVFERCAGSSTEDKVVSGVKSEYVSKLATEHVDFRGSNSNPRKNAVSKITIHHMAGVMGATQCALMHANNPAKQASANYYIGNDGVICSGIPENYRAWTSGTGNEYGTNDHMAITIEVSNSRNGKEDPRWPVSDKAYASLIALCADICKRYGISPKFTGDKSGTLTIHSMFQPTACPGPYLTELHKTGTIERDILLAMGQPAATLKDEKVTEKPKPKKTLHKVQSADMSSLADARKFCDGVKKSGTDCFVGRIGEVYRVQAGAYAAAASAKKLVTKLGKAGFAMQVTSDDLESVTEEQTDSFKPYVVRIAVGALNVRKAPASDAEIQKVVMQKEAFTIVEERAKEGYVWGKLKSGAGWIRLDYTERV